VVLLGNGAVADRNALALAADYGVELAGRMSFGLAPLPGVPDCTAMGRALEWARANHGAGAHVERALLDRPTWLQP
jgi:hypothetical protein